MEATKTCKKCGETKLLSDFHLDANRKDGRTARCKPCERERKKEYERTRRKDPVFRARKAKFSARWHQTPEGARYRLAYRLKGYGLTLAAFEEMERIQGGLCAICLNPPDAPKLFVDHDHKTGEVRGLLCDSCNKGLGNFEDDLDRLARASAYLARNHRDMPEATDLARKTEEIASRDIGTMEDPPGSNRGERIEEYLAYTGLAPGNAYCASANSLWVHEAAAELGITPQLRKSGSALGLVRNNPELFFTEVTAADLPCIGINEDADHVHGHAFLIIGMDENGKFQTIDPNSNPAGAREGTGVWLLNRRTAADANRRGYIRIA